MGKPQKSKKDRIRFFTALRQHLKSFEEDRVGGRADRKYCAGIRVAGIPNVTTPVLAKVIPLPARAVEDGDLIGNIEAAMKGKS